MRITRDTLLGLMFFVGLGLLILATVFLSELALGGTRQIPIQFDTAIGLKAGDPVNVVGVKKGYVQSIEYRPENPKDRRVVIRLQLARDIRVHDDYKVRIEYASLLGGRLVNMDPGSIAGVEILADEDHPLIGIVAKDPILAFTDLINDNKSPLNEALVAIRDTFQSAATGKGAINKLLNDPELARKLDSIVTNVEKIIDTVSKGEGPLGVALRDKDVEQKLRNIVRDVESVTGKLDRGEALLGKLISDKDLGAKVERAINNIEEVTGKLARGEGSFGKLVNSSEAHDKLVKLFDSAQVTLDKLNGGDGLLSKLLNDKEIGIDVKEAIRAVKDLVTGANRGEGTIGRLFKDDTLVRNLERLVRQFGRLIEDAREAAPVSTFASVLFGAF